MICRGVKYSPVGLIFANCCMEILDAHRAVAVGGVALATVLERAPSVRYTVGVGTCPRHTAHVKGHNNDGPSVARLHLTSFNELHPC